MPSNPSTDASTSRAACGGQTETITSARRASSAAEATSSTPAASARPTVAPLRPSEVHRTAVPAPRSAAPIAAPISPGCRSPTVAIGRSLSGGERGGAAAGRRCEAVRARSPRDVPQRLAVRALLPQRVAAAGAAAELGLDRRQAGEAALARLELGLEVPQPEVARVARALGLARPNEPVQGRARERQHDGGSAPGSRPLRAAAARVRDRPAGGSGPEGEQRDRPERVDHGEDKVGHGGSTPPAAAGLRATSELRGKDDFGRRRAL